MLTQFVTLKISLQDSPIALQQTIVKSLCAHGEPLRWAITQIDPDNHVVSVEAVVTIPDSLVTLATSRVTL